MPALTTGSTQRVGRSRKRTCGRLLCNRMKSARGGTTRSIRGSSIEVICPGAPSSSPVASCRQPGHLPHCRRLRITSSRPSPDAYPDPLDVELGSATLELGGECPRKRHRGHGLPGSRVGDGLANPVLGYSQRLHQFNLIALVLGRLKFRLSTAPFLGHFDLFFVILRELNSYLVNYCRSNFCRTAPLCGLGESPFPLDAY